jgi:hypothetical protein
MGRGARPSPGLRVCDQSRPHRIELRIPQCFPEVRLVQGTGIVPPLPNMAARVVSRVPVGRIPPVRVFQGQCQPIGFVGDHDHVNMIGHEAVANQRHTVELSILSQQIEIDHAISVGVQDKSSPIPTLCDMVRYINGNDPSQACHASDIIRKRSVCPQVSPPGFPPRFPPGFLRFPPRFPPGFLSPGFRSGGCHEDYPRTAPGFPTVPCKGWSVDILPMRSMALFFPVGTAADGRLRRKHAAPEGRPAAVTVVELITPLA